MTETITQKVGAVTVETEFNFDGLFGFVEERLVGEIEFVHITIDEWANEVTKWMKQNAPWQDRTEDERRAAGVPEGAPHAREVLGVITDFKEELIEVVLTGGVFYQKFLEMHFRDVGGKPRFAILKPAFELWMPVLLKRLGAELE